MKEVRFKKHIIEELKNLKKEMPFDYEVAYNRIYNICNECECEYSEPNLTAYLEDENFVNDEWVTEYIKENPDITRLRYFIGDTYDASLYKLDGYGNLSNILEEDLQFLCDSLINMIDENIKELEQDEM